MPSDKRQRKRQNSQARAAAHAAARRRQERRRRGLAAGVVAALAIALVLVLVVQGGGKKKNTKVASTVTSTTVRSTTTPTYGTTPCPNPDGSAARKTTFAAPPQKCIVDGKTYTATMVTDVGTMTIALDARQAPMTVNNFVFLARYHFYDGLTFHRVIPGFVDQGGDPLGTGQGGPGYQFADELPAAGAYKIGSVAMANSGANTNGSQFFIIVGAQGAQLPPSYSLFGTVTQGIDVAHKIEADGSASGTPKVVHKILSVTITES